MFASPAYSGDSRSFHINVRRLQEWLEWLISHGFEFSDLGILGYLICAMYVSMAMEKSKASEVMADIALLSYNAAYGVVQAGEACCLHSSRPF